MINSIEGYLQKLWHNRRIPHALLFAGPPHSAAHATALQFAQQIVGEASPDLYCYAPEGKLGLHTMETTRSFIDEVYLPPYQAAYKVFLILEAERMAAPPANALLKTFEEPPATSLIFLVSHFPEKILSTLRSRCQALYFRGEKSQRESLPLLTELLTTLPTAHYVELFAQVAALADAIEKEAAQPPQEEGQELTALQKQAREKEEEGKQALAILRATESLWEQILGWFRDMHLLHLNGNPEQLFHPAHEPFLRAVIEKGRLPSLDSLQKIVSQTRLSLERSAPLKNSLESLFLAVNKLC